MLETISTRSASAAGRIDQSSALRVLLVGGCAAAIAVALWTGDPAGYVQADPALARLLRGMALIKAGVALGALLAVLWRFEWPVSRSAAVVYLLGSWSLAGATVMIWELTQILPAAIAFHAAGLAMLVAAWRDDRISSP